MAEFLVTHPCQDACGTLTTDRAVGGAPVYRCPGCDSEWYEPREQTEPTAHQPEGSSEPAR